MCIFNLGLTYGLSKLGGEAGTTAPISASRSPLTAPAEGSYSKMIQIPAMDTAMATAV